MADRRKAVDTPRFGGLVSGGPAVVPVVAFWGCWVGAGSVVAMGFDGGEVLLVRACVVAEARAAGGRGLFVDGRSLCAGGEGRVFSNGQGGRCPPLVGNARVPGAMPTLGGPAPWPALQGLAPATGPSAREGRVSSNSVRGGIARVLLGSGDWPFARLQVWLRSCLLDGLAVY